MQYSGVANHSRALSFVRHRTGAGIQGGAKGGATSHAAYGTSMLAFIHRRKLLDVVSSLSLLIVRASTHRLAHLSGTKILLLRLSQWRACLLGCDPFGID